MVKQWIVFLLLIVATSQPVHAQAIGVKPEAELIVVPLVDGTWATAVHQQTIVTDHHTTWVGRLAEEPLSNVVLVWDANGRLTGEITSTQGIFQLHPDGSVSQLMQSEMGTVGTVSVSSPTSQPEIGASLPVRPTLDVLVLYTNDTATAVGSNTNMESLIQLAVAQTNLSFENSRVNQRVATTFVSNINYDESGELATHLSDLAGTSDGTLDDVHLLRDQYHADFVMLVVESTDNGSCGLAYVQETPGPAFASNAFSVVKRSCLTGNYSFAQLLGHNMGLQNDWYVNDATQPTIYAHGYVRRSDGWRTIMAENDLCGDHPINTTNCTRLLYWSNPLVTYEGDSMGVAPDNNDDCVAGAISPDPETCAAHSQQLLNELADLNSSFRDSVVRWTGDVSNDWQNSNNWEIVIGGTAVNQLPRPYDDVFIPSSATRYPVLNSGTAVVRHLILDQNTTLTMNGGTLEVYGDWYEDVGAQTSMTNGTVRLMGQEAHLKTSSESQFTTLQIGNGTNTANITLDSQVTIGDELHIQANANLHGANQTIILEGDWRDDGHGFVYKDSTVMMNGSAGTAVKLTTTTLLTQTFSLRDGQGFSSAAPAGWTALNNGTDPNARWWFGDTVQAPNTPNSAGHARRFSPSGSSSIDAWLYTPPLTLYADRAYEVQFNYGTQLGTTQQFSVVLNDERTTTGGETVFNDLSASHDEWETGIGDFAVEEDGIYYLAFRNSDSVPSGDYGAIDDIRITAKQDITFNHLVISGTMQFNSNVIVQGALHVADEGVMDLQTFDLRVDGDIDVNGRLQQTRPVPRNSLTQFLHIEDSDGTLVYGGLDLTATEGSMGDTTIVLEGGAPCPDSDILANTIPRCLQLLPTTNQTATLKLYYQQTEVGGVLDNNLTSFLYGGSGSWARLETSNRNNGNQIGWVETQNVWATGVFVLSDGQPTAVGLLPPKTQSNVNPIWHSLFGLLLVSVLMIWYKKPLKKG